MKILCGQLNCSVKFADVSTRCSSHPQGKSEVRWLLHSRAHQSKLEALLKRKQKQPELHPEGRDQWVVNLTERVLTLNQQEILRMGLNYAPVPTKFPLQDTIASVEELARQLPKDDADDL